MSGKPYAPTRRRPRPRVRSGVLRRRSFLAATAALACGRAGAPGPARLLETRDTVLARIDEWREKLPVVGLSVALVDRDGLAWAVAVGEADREARRLAAPDTIYALGSLTKPYLALTALHAAERGRLDLDAPLIGHLPELRAPGADAITARHVLCHRSGLLSEWHRGGLAARPPDWRQLAAEIGGEPLIAPPDRWYAYSNVAYTLLGHVLERMSDRPLQDLVDEAVAAALGASRPVFEPPPELAPTYLGGRRVAAPRVRHAPAAGLHGSVLDLAALLRRLLEGTGPAAAMLAPQAAGPLDFGERWGLGLALRHTELEHAGRVAWHAGRTYGHRAVLFALPDRGLGVAVLANFREAGGAEDLAVLALQTALLERDGLDLPPTRGDAELPPPAPVDPAALQAHLGRYANEHDIAVLAVEDGAFVSRSGTDRTVLHPTAGGDFLSADNPDARVRLVDRAGFHVLMTAVRGVETRVGVRCPEGPVPSAWLARLGRYRPETRPGEVTMFQAAHLERVAGGLQLRLESPQPFQRSSTVARYALLPADDRAATIFGVGRGKGQRVLAGDDDALSWAGYRLVRDPA